MDRTPLSIRSEIGNTQRYLNGPILIWTREKLRARENNYGRQ